MPNNLTILNELATALGLTPDSSGLCGRCPCCGTAGTFSVFEQDGGYLCFCSSGCSWPALSLSIRSRKPSWTPALRSIAELEAQRQRAVLEIAGKLWNEVLPLRYSSGVRFFERLGAEKDAAASPALRFHHATRHPDEAERMAAVLARVVDSNGDFCSLHTIYVDPTTCGPAQVALQCASTGRTFTGGVRIEPVDRTIVVAVGVEGALVAGSLAGLPSIAVQSLAALEHEFEMPPAARNVVVACHANERAGRAAELTAYRWRGQGIEVRIEKSPRLTRVHAINSGRAA